jgi:hypothetical protein
MPLLNVFVGEYHRTTECLPLRSASYSAGLAVEYMRPCLSNLHKSHPLCAELSSAAKVACTMTVLCLECRRLMIAPELALHLSHLLCSDSCSILTVVIIPALASLTRCYGGAL